MMTLSFLKQCWLPLALVGLVALGAWLIHHEAWEGGRTEANAEWQAKWDAHALADSEATRIADAAERTKEQARQAAMNKVIQDGQKIIDNAVADASAHADATRSLHNTVDHLTGALADSEASGSACATSASKAAAKAARVLADVFKLADQAAGTMAATADQAMTRGSLCERAYDALGASQ